MNTFCPFLWDEFFIDQDGSVYACCHSQPTCFGNIHRDRLRDLAASDQLREFRQRSLAGELHCHAGCRLLDGTERPAACHRVDAPYEEYSRLKILFGEFCNIACVMCWQEHHARGALDHRRLLDSIDLAPFAEIDIQGGEPLAIKEARRFFDALAQQGKRACFLTNGLPITDELAERIARHCYRIHISLNAATAQTHELVNKGSRWRRVMANLARLREAKRALGSDVIIGGHMTIIERNLAEIPAFITEIGPLFDEVSFFYDTAVPGLLDGDPELRGFLRAATMRALACCGDRVSAFGKARLRQLGLNE